MNEITRDRPIVILNGRAVRFVHVVIEGSAPVSEEHNGHTIKATVAATHYRVTGKKSGGGQISEGPFGEIVHALRPSGREIFQFSHKL